MISNDLTRLHVVGCPRSGTTLMMEMLVVCYEHEGQCEHEETFFVPPETERGLYISKQPNDINWIEPIARKDPRAFFVAMIRDPRSVVCSMHAGHQDMYFCNYRIWKKAERALSRLSDLDNVVVVRYEDLVCEPDAVQQRIETRYPFLCRKHRFSEFHHYARVSDAASKALGGVRPVQNQSPGWKKHLPRLKHQIEANPGMLEDLIKLGYEEGHAWQEMLADVEPELFRCRYLDRATPLKDLESRFRIGRKIKRYLAERDL